MHRNQWALLALWPVLLPGMVWAEPDVTPEQVRAALPKFEALAKQTLEKTGVPGMAVVVVFRDEVVFLRGFGVREAGTNKPVDADTVFQIASMSKPIASTVLAALVGDGVIGWDDRLTDHLPGFRLSDPWVTSEVTIRDMLCHRSGLPTNAGDEVALFLGYDRSEVFRRLHYYKPASSFRSQFAYTNFGFAAAAEAGACAAKKSWETLAAEKIYQPLGMKSTSSRFADYAAAPNRALPHVRVDGQWTARYTVDADPQSPAGGVSSSVRDISAWMRLQLAGGKFAGKQLISATALAETHRPQIDVGPYLVTGQAARYGLGWFVIRDEHGRVFWKHGGAHSPGNRADVTLLPRQQLGIAIFLNAFPSWIPEALSQSFLDLVLTGAVEKDWLALGNKQAEVDVKTGAALFMDYSDRAPPPNSPALPADSYLGVYRNDLYGDLTVAAKDGKLVLSLGRKLVATPLRHWDRDLFVLDLPDFHNPRHTGVLFTIDGNGRASRVLLDVFDVFSGQGTFVRVTEKPKGIASEPQLNPSVANEPASAPAEDQATNKVGVDTSGHKTTMVTVAPDVQVEVLDWGGTGEPMVLLTGLGDNANVFDHFAHQFTDRFHVIGITRRGFGRSSQPAEGYDVDTRARDDIKVLDYLHVPKAVFVGHSLAGDELSKLGAAYPDRVTKLVYLDALEYGRPWSTLPQPPSPDYADADLTSVERYAAAEARNLGVRKPMSAIYNMLRTDATGKVVDAISPPEIAKKIVQGSQQAQYDRIKAPVLAIFVPLPSKNRSVYAPYYADLNREQQQEYDRSYEKLQKWQTDAFERLRTGIKNARVVELPDSHHYVFIRDEARVVREMRKFLLDQ